MVIDISRRKYRVRQLNDLFFLTGNNIQKWTRSGPKGDMCQPLSHQHAHTRTIPYSHLELSTRAHPVPCHTHISSYRHTNVNFFITNCLLRHKHCLVQGRSVYTVWQFFPSLSLVCVYILIFFWYIFVQENCCNTLPWYNVFSHDHWYHKWSSIFHTFAAATCFDNENVKTRERQMTQCVYIKISRKHSDWGLKLSMAMVKFKKANR